MLDDIALLPVGGSYILVYLPSGQIVQKLSAQRWIKRGIVESGAIFWHVLLGSFGAILAGVGRVVEIVGHNRNHRRLVTRLDINWSPSSIL